MKLIISILLALIGSKSIEGQNSCENKLKKELTKNWKYDSVKKRYFANHKFLNQLDSVYKDCLHGKDTTYISNLFGQHYLIRPVGKNFQMEYNMFPCDDPICGFFYFVLDEKYKVTIDYSIEIDGRANPIE